MQGLAFSLISSGVYGYPKDKALKVAIESIRTFLSENDMRVYLVVFDVKTFEMAGLIEKSELEG